MHTDLRNTIVNLSIASQRLINHIFKEKNQMSTKSQWVCELNNTLYQSTIYTSD